MLFDPFDSAIIRSNDSNRLTSEYEPNYISIVGPHEIEVIRSYPLLKGKRVYVLSYCLPSLVLFSARKIQITGILMDPLITTLKRSIRILSFTRAYRF